MAETVSLRAAVHGRVQGVGFRYSTVSRARRLTLKGYVRNRNDGSVEVVAEGPRSDLEKLLEWLRRGPSAAYVRHVDHRFESATGVYDDFDVSF